MIQATQAKRSEFPHTPATEPEVLDALIIGAGVAGLYQIHQLRKQGLNVLGVDTATDVGGTWYWNRYPGAKFDSEAYIYQYLFDEDLYKDWTWSQRFPAQPEIERWMHRITDRLELRPNLRFSTTVTSAAYDPERGRWLITTDTGATFDAQFLIGCGGMLSAPLENRFPGQETFNGRIFHTARWPREPLTLTGMRRRGRMRRDRDPGHSVDCKPGRRIEGIRAYTAIHPADEKPVLRAGGRERVQGTL